LAIRPSHMPRTKSGGRISNVPLHPSGEAHRRHRYIKSEGGISVCSVPSIRLANRLRSESAASVDSWDGQRRQHCVISDSGLSLESFPSIYRAARLRSGSTTSFGSDKSPRISAIELSSQLRKDPSVSSEQNPSLQSQTEISRNSLRPSPESPSLGVQRPIAEEPSSKCLLTPLHSNIVDKAATNQSKPLLLRRASNSIYEGEGIEVTEMFDDPMQKSKSSFSALDVKVSSGFELSWLGTKPMGGSFDDGICEDSSMRRENLVDKVMAHQELKRSLSDDTSYIRKSIDLEDDGASWNMDDDQDTSAHPNAWNILQDEYAAGYGGGGNLPFLILGTSADDVASHPHVLSPPLMESLQCFFPYAVSEDNFWMKFSMIRDGASLQTLLQNVRGAQHTIIALETVGGEVFGSFTSAAWRKNWNYFGTGESFLWRMRENRGTKCISVIDQAQLESELDVYPWTGENDFVQFCTHDKIAVGGGTKNKNDHLPHPTKPGIPVGSGGGAIDRELSWDKKDDHDFGFGLTIDEGLLHGISNPCLTFGSPPLCKAHPNGSAFEILNLEVWTLTPCMTEEEAEKLELGRLFLASNNDN